MRLLLLSTFLLLSLYSFSQNKNLGIGLQSTFPTKGFSLRYDLDSVNQYQLSYTIFKDNSLDRTLYGGKYSRIINRFKYFQSGYNAGYSFGKSFWGAFAVIGVYLTFAAKTAI